jgi:prophage regulatory protein
MAKRIITHDHLKDYGITLGKLQVWRLETAGKFPKRVQVSPGRIGWLENEIEAYIDARIAERDAKLADAAA